VSNILLIIYCNIIHSLSLVGNIDNICSPITHSWPNPRSFNYKIDLEENSNFHVFDDNLVDVDAEELNVVLSSSGQANVDEDNDIHIEDCDEGDDYSIDDEEEENSD